MKKIEVLWHDSDHLWYVEGFIDAIREMATDINIVGSSTQDENELIGACVNKNILIFHCGTIRPKTSSVGILTKAKQVNPSLRIGLQTNAVVDDLVHLVDFYVETPIETEELINKIRTTR